MLTARVFNAKLRLYTSQEDQAYCSKTIGKALSELEGLNRKSKQIIAAKILSEVVAEYDFIQAIAFECIA